MTLRRHEQWRRRESDPRPPRCKRGALPVELHPQVRTGGVEPPQPEAAGLQPVELADAQRPRDTLRATGRDRTGAAGITTPGATDYTTVTMTGTTGLEPAASRLTSECSALLSYAPKGKEEREAKDSRSCRWRGRRTPSSSAGGIRTRGLELMRLARTAAPLPRKSAWLESNQRSPAPEAGGVAVSPTGR